MSVYCNDGRLTVRALEGLRYPHIIMHHPVLFKYKGRPGSVRVSYASIWTYSGRDFVNQAAKKALRHERLGHDVNGSANGGAAAHA
jgi:hypothetical protein